MVEPTEYVRIPVLSKDTVYYYIIDKYDLERVSQYTWSYCNGYIKNGKYRMLLHRFLMNVLNKPEVMIDHINGNRLDNRKSNLRICTNQENCMNRSKRKNCSSIYKGVIYNKTQNKFIVNITKNGNIMSLGRYKTAEEAGRVYDKYAKIHFGEFAKLNFPDEE